MNSFIPECKRRLQLARLHYRIGRLTRRLLSRARRSTEPLPIKELRQLECVRVSLGTQCNPTAVEAELRLIEQERGLV